MVNESSNRAAEIQEVVKKLGYSSLEEIKKEKALLTKLEGLMKELGTARDVSEDEAEEIENEVLAKGEPKSLAGKAGEKEEDGEPGGTAEVSEDAAEEIEDETVAMGEPQDRSEEEGEEVVTKDQEVTDEVPAEADDEDAGVEVPKARIMTFEEFTKSKIQEKEVTVNKKVSYQSDEEEPEDYSVPIAASADPLAEDSAEEIEDETVAMGEPQDHSEAEGEVVVTKDQKITKKPETSEDEPEEHGEVVVEKEIINEAKEIAIGSNGIDYNDNIVQVIAVGSYDQIAKMFKDKMNADPSEYGFEKGPGKFYFTKTLRSTEGDPGDYAIYPVQYDFSNYWGLKPTRVKVKESVGLNEKEITNEKDFEKYAMEIMKQAHPDDFDEEIATKVVTDLKAKYKGDFGAMVGALQSGMGA